MNILLCEDDQAYVDTVVFMFEMFSAEDTVTAVKSLHEAVQLLTRYHPLDFDCILLDLNLPDAKELEALVRLSQLTQDIPIIVLSSWPTWKHESLQIGAKAYKVKNNIGGEDLVALVHTITNRERLC